MNFRDINTLVNQRRREIVDIVARADDTVYGTVAPFWKDTFATRPNFLTAEQFNMFRNPSTSAIFGVGGQRDEGEMAALFEQAVVEFVDAHGIPDDVIAKINEPIIGAPPVRPYRGNLFSPVFLNNIAPVWRAIQAAKQFGPVGRPLRICEIGAGFGAGAVILHQLLDIESYTVIDLAENLYMSSLFLPAALARSHRMVDPKIPESLSCGAQINFSLASFTDKLTAAPFDLVWNRASMGEMPKATAQAYIAWIKSHLAEDGIFFFANRFNVPKANGASGLSDYGLQDFNIRNVRPVERVSRPANQIHIEIVASPPTPKTHAIQSIHLNTVGNLIACGFDPQIKDICDALVSGNVDAATDTALQQLNAFFAPSPIHKKRELLQSAALNALGEIVPVLDAAINLLGSGMPLSQTEKSALFSRNLGLKLETRIRGLCAETEARSGGDLWIHTLQPLKVKSPSLHRMSELLILQAKNSFSGCFKRDLRVMG